MCFLQTDSGCAAPVPSLHCQKIARAKWEFLFGTPAEEAAGRGEKRESISVLLTLSFCTFCLHVLPSSHGNISHRDREASEVAVLLSMSQFVAQGNILRCDVSADTGTAAGISSQKLFCLTKENKIRALPNIILPFIVNILVSTRISVNFIYCYHHRNI